MRETNAKVVVTGGADAAVDGVSSPVPVNPAFDSRTTLLEVVDLREGLGATVDWFRATADT